MSHSNRQTLRDARGGKTRHQDMKASRKAKYRSAFDPAERIKVLQAHQIQLDLARMGKGPKSEITTKARTINMWASTVKRRVGALGRLEAQLKSTNTLVPEMDKEELVAYQFIFVARVEREMKTLRQRI